MIPLDELKEHLNLTGPDDDAYLVDLEMSAVQFVETQTGRYFGPLNTLTEYRNGNSTEDLFVSNEPSGTVTIQRRASATSTPEVVDPSEFAVRGRRLVNPTGWGADEYEITYETGYASGAEPGDIRAAVRDLVALSYSARAGIGAESITGAIRASADSDDTLRATLRVYRRKRYGIA